MNIKAKICSVLIFTFIGCSSVVPTNPENVAKQFINHIRLKQYDQARQYVVLTDRIKFVAREFERELNSYPPIPVNPVIVVKVDKKKGFFRVKNWSSRVKVELVFKNNRWWIKK